MINVLYIIDSLAHGGAEKQLVLLIRNLDPENFRPHLCTLKPSEGLYDELDIPKICLGSISFGHPSIASKVAALSSFIRRHQIRVAQTYFQDPFLLGAMVKPFTGVKLIGTFLDLGFWRTAGETRKMRMAYPFFSGFIANSQAVKNHFVQRDRIRAEKIEVIYNGVDLGGIRPKALEEQIGNPLVVGIVANLNRPVKRVQDFIQAASIIHGNHPNVQFVIVGDGHLRPGLENLAQSLGLEHVLRFTGRLADPFEEIRRFSVGVITSETEGFCNAILEYMACGVPVVATEAGGNPELVKDGESGFLIPVGDVQKLSRQIEKILMDPSLQRGISVVNLACVKDRYSLARMVSDHQAYYGF